MNHWQLLNGSPYPGIGVTVDLWVSTVNVDGKGNRTFTGERVVDCWWEPDSENDATWAGGKWMRYSPYGRDNIPVESESSKATHWMPVPLAPGEVAIVSTPLVDRLSQKVADLPGISVRIRNCLSNIDITYVGDLVQKDEAKLLREPNFGRKSMDELISILARMGLTMAMNVPEWSRPAAMYQPDA